STASPLPPTSSSTLWLIETLRQTERSPSAKGWVSYLSGTPRWRRDWQPAFTRRPTRLVERWGIPSIFLRTCFL
ncbi:unnamed protein product, partial [Ectocarpus sp. 13 AM-2016]